MAAGEGFEPSHTESESAVLPLHNPAVFLTNKNYYTHLGDFVNSFLVRKRNYFFRQIYGRDQTASRSEAVKYLLKGLYSSANTTTHKMMLSSI